jgi:hypothetical protein
MEQITTTKRTKKLGNKTNKLKEQFIMEQNLKIKEQITTRCVTNIQGGTKIHKWNKNLHM